MLFKIVVIVCTVELPQYAVINHVVSTDTRLSYVCTHIKFGSRTSANMTFTSYVRLDYFIVDANILFDSYA